MIHLRTNQKGFSIVEIGIVIAVIVGLGAVGYTFYSRQQAKSASQAAPLPSSATAPSQTTQLQELAPIPAINTPSDLDKAAAVLDQTTIGESSSSDMKQLDGQESGF